MDEKLIDDIANIISSWGASKFSERDPDPSPYDDLNEQQLAQLIVKMVRESK